MVRFLAGFLYAHHRYYLFKHSIEDIARLTEADFMPKTDNFIFRIVSSKQDLDGLWAEGLDLLAYIADAEHRLKSGAVAFCIFVGSELAHISWMAMTQKAKDSLNEPPCKMAFRAR